MNTQAHLLLAAALLCRSVNVRPITPSSNADTSFSVWPGNTAVLVGALLPDASLFIMFAQARIRGIDHQVIWNELYYSAFWQYIGAMTNSIPIYLFLAIVGFSLLSRMRTLATVVLVFGLAALLHCLTDLPLHVDDGHAHFWPFTAWVYESPVSYWDSNHYANYWRPIEFLIACMAVLTVWRRFKSIWVRVAVIAGLLSYPVIMAFWFYAMH